ncbi:hypothetical protein PVA48_15010 [Akkermansia sp. JRP_AM1]|uniref:type II restriction enzyme n=1 Tax=Akkermansia sp. JRP_AM1 TaxID=3414159 RepID=UPI003BFA6BA5
MNRYKNDIAWEQIFEKHRILDAIKSKGRVTISSTDINEFREARLMTKFDHRSQLPIYSLKITYQFYLHPEALMKSVLLKLFVLLKKKK